MPGQRTRSRPRVIRLARQGRYDMSGPIGEAFNEAGVLAMNSFCVLLLETLVSGPAAVRIASTTCLASGLLTVI